jgi:hypothetical protein
MERAVALVSTHFSTAGSEEWADPEVSPECVQFVICLHSVTLPQSPPNQWISSLVVRLAYTLAAALAEIMIVV